MPNPNNPKHAQVFHFDIYGKREAKYDFLNSESIASIPWKELDCPEPYHFFVPKDFSLESQYESFFNLDQLFKVYGNGIGTDRDKLFYDFNSNELTKRFKTFYSDELIDADFRVKFNVKNSSSYNISGKRERTIFDKKFIQKAIYRPFDWRFLYYNPELISRPAADIMKIIDKENHCLITTRQVSTGAFKHVLITNCICDRDPLSVATKERSQIFPLYLYQESTTQISIEGLKSRQPNLNLQIIGQIAEKLCLKFTSEKLDEAGTFAPIDMLDYIYAVLHSPTYREKYKEFLKIDFPRVPYPKDPETFWQLVRLGGELRQIHLLESPEVGKYITQYPVGGTNLVEKVRYDNGNVFINEAQYFANVPKVAWEFYIGGYQPAQKWLKDRKGRELGFDDILHYQKIIVALSATDRLMREIDKIEFDSE